MLSIVLAMLVIMMLAGIVVLYVAFPHRGEDVPHTPWVGEAMRKGVDMLPTLDNQRSWEEQEPAAQPEPAGDSPVPSQSQSRPEPPPEPQKEPQGR